MKAVETNPGYLTSPGLKLAQRAENGRTTWPLSTPMPPPAYIAYLDAYNKQLGAAGRTGTLARLFNWQHREFYRSQARAVADLNQALGYAAGDPTYLQPNHLPTTAVGSMDGLVIVAANPGFNALINPHEHAARITSPTANYDFCRNLFSAYPKALNRTIRFWSFALGLYAEAFHGGPPQIHGRARWYEASGPDPWLIGGVELLPFHSSRDAITGAFGSAHPAPHMRALEATARASLEMTCAMPLKGSVRLTRRVAIVASKGGDALVRQMASEPTPSLTALPAGTKDAQWSLTRWLHHSDRTIVLSLPYQLFSRAAPAGFRRGTLAEIIRTPDLRK